MYIIPQAISFFLVGIGYVGTFIPTNKWKIEKHPVLWNGSEFIVFVIRLVCARCCKIM